MSEASIFIAFLRGINVGGHAAVPMKQLKEICSSLGWSDVRTLLNSGNVIFAASGPASKLERELEEALSSAFGLKIVVMVRGYSDLLASTKDGPFLDERTNEPAKVAIGFSKSPQSPDAVEVASRYAKAGERIVQANDLLWVYFPQGMGRSKIAPNILEKASGSPTTSRNWNTISRILGHTE